MKIDPKKRKILINFLKNKLKEIDKKNIQIITAIQLNDVTKQYMIKELSFLKDKEINFIVDDSLIGGYKIIYGTSVIDASIKNYLQNIKDNIYQNN